MNRSAKKDSLRSALLDRRQAMPFEEVYRLSSVIQKRFLRSVFYVNARRIALYASFRNEVLTDEIFQRAALDGKEVYFPRIESRHERVLNFYKVGHKREMASGSFDIMEPGSVSGKAYAGPFDIVVVPCVGFDVTGARLGFGKGYYDRALKDVSCPIAALAYGFQLIDGALPSEEHDVRVSAIVTEKKIFNVG